MTKISNLPKASSSSKNDLIVVVQGEKTMHISKESFLAAIENLSAQNASNIKGLQNQLAKKSINKKSPVFTSAVKALDPSDPKHLTTKSYVDKELHNVLRDDGAKKLNTPLSFHKQPLSFKSEDLISKKYADDLLLGVLKTIQNFSSNTLPIASVGQCFIMTEAFEVFAEDGPEIQKGDILICLDNSVGGTYSSVGHQFAIINSNVVSASEDNKGIVHIATGNDMETYESDSKVITPVKYKQSLDASFMYNRTLIDSSTYTVLEEDRGILAIDNRRSSCTITLPSISSLTNANMFKIVIKDEFGQANLKNITIKATGATIDSNTQITLLNKYQAVTIYNDGKNYYIENNTHAPDEVSEKLIQSGLVMPVATGTAFALYTATLDLNQFDVGQGFIIETSGFFAANGNTKTVAIDVAGTTTVTNATTTAPNSDHFTARLTVIKANKNAIAYGYMLLEGIAADTYGTYSLDLDWNSTIKLGVTANAATATTDIQIYSMIVEPLK